jgi:hypothetical protein
LLWKQFKLRRTGGIVGDASLGGAFGGKVRARTTWQQHQVVAVVDFVGGVLLYRGGGGSGVSWECLWGLWW